MATVRHPLGGWLAPGKPFQWQREDHGQDLAIGGDHVIDAPGDGVCVSVLSDAAFPNGFGPSYPVVEMHTGRFAGHQWYLGHTSSMVTAGQSFNFGHHLARADQSERVSGWPAGWVELGQAYGGGPGRDNPPHWYRPLFSDLVVNVPDPVLRQGTQGPRVLLMTSRLHSLGYMTRGWWHFTHAVDIAVRKFQADHKLHVDGLVGPATWTAIKVAKPPRRKPAPHPQPKPSSATRVSKGAVAGIADFEGGQSSDGLFHPYRDPVGVWTIGYGHIEGVNGGSHALTKNQAMALLLADLDKTYAPQVVAAQRHYGWPMLTQNQFDALVSFCFNLGAGYFSPGHTIGHALQAHDMKGAAQAILIYDKAGGVALAGLTRRRKWESNLFSKH